MTLQDFLLPIPLAREPKRPSSAFFLFVGDRRPALASLQPKEMMAQIEKKTAESHDSKPKLFAAKVAETKPTKAAARVQTEAAAADTLIGEVHGQRLWRRI